MNQLPYELFSFILQHCDIDDLFNVRLVSKKFNSVVSDFKPRELVFDNAFKYMYNWWWTNERIEFNCVLDTSRLFLLSSSIVNLSCLKRLILDGKNRNYQFQLEDLNRLHRLEQLEVNLNLIDLRSLTDETSTLSLRNLKILYIFHEPFTRLDKLKYLKFDTPNLETVRLEGTCSSSFQVVNPLSIKHLKVYAFVNHLSVFENVVYFEYDRNLVDLDILETFPKLNEIHCDGHRALESLLQPTVRSKRPMKIYYGDYQLFTLEDLDRVRKFDVGRYGYRIRGRLSRQIRNYSILANKLTYNHRMIYYNELMDLINEHLDGSFPIDFFTKYNNIQQVYIKTDVDEHKAIDFLSNCSNLGLLVVVNSNLNKSSFYDQLPSLRPALVELEIFEESDLNLDFEFVSKLFYLRTLRTNQELSMNAIRQLPKLKRLERVEFRFLKTYYTIDQLQAGKYNLSEENGAGFLKKGIDLIDLVKWFEYLISGASITTRSEHKRLRVR